MRRQDPIKINWQWLRLRSLICLALTGLIGVQPALAAIRNGRIHIDGASIRNMKKEVRFENRQLIDAQLKSAEILSLPTITELPSKEIADMQLLKPQDFNQRTRNISAVGVSLAFLKQRLRPISQATVKAISGMRQSNANLAGYNARMQFNILTGENNPRYPSQDLVLASNAADLKTQGHAIFSSEGKKVKKQALVTDSRKIRKNILVCQHEPTEDLRLWESLLKSRGVDIHYADFSRKPNFRPELSGHDGLVLLGGTVNVHEAPQKQYLQHEMQLIRQAAAEAIPVFGICLGAQLVAQALGGQVTKCPKPEIGWFNLQPTRAGMRDPVFANQDDLRVFLWHEYEFSLPKGASLLASSRLCRNQAFRLGAKIFAVQFHFEVGSSMIEYWLDTSSLKGTPKDAMIRKDTKRRFPGYKEFGRRIWEAYLALL